MSFTASLSDFIVSLAEAAINSYFCSSVSSYFLFSRHSSSFFKSSFFFLASFFFYRNLDNSSYITKFSNFISLFKVVTIPSLTPANSMLTFWDTSSLPVILA